MTRGIVAAPTVSWRPWHENVRRHDFLRSASMPDHYLQRRSLEGELWLETGLFKCIVEFFRRKLVAFAVGERLLVNRKEIRRDRGVPLIPRLGVAPPVPEDIELRCIPMMLTAQILSHRA